MAARRTELLEFAVLGLLHETPHARVRAAQAAQRRARPVPRAVLRHALPLPAGTARPGLDHRGDRGPHDEPRTVGQQARAHRLRAHRRRQGAVPGPAQRGRADRLGGRHLRRPLRLLRPHRGRGPAAHPRGPSQPPRGAAGEHPHRLRQEPRALRQLHRRARTARAGLRRARGPLAQRADHRRARTPRPPPSSTTSRTTNRSPRSTTRSYPMGSIRVAIVGVGNCASSLVQGVEYYKDADPTGTVPGLMHVMFGDYHVKRRRVRRRLRRGRQEGRLRPVRGDQRLREQHHQDRRRRPPPVSPSSAATPTTASASTTASDHRGVRRRAGGHRPGAQGRQGRRARLLPPGGFGDGRQVLRPVRDRRERRLRQRPAGLHRLRPRVGREVRGGRRAGHR